MCIISKSITRLQSHLQEYGMLIENKQLTSEKATGGGWTKKKYWYTFYILKCSFTYTMATVNPPLTQCFHIIFS